VKAAWPVLLVPGPFCCPKMPTAKEREREGRKRGEWGKRGERESYSAE